MARKTEAILSGSGAGALALAKLWMERNNVTLPNWADPFILPAAAVLALIAVYLFFKKDAPEIGRTGGQTASGARSVAVGGDNHGLVNTGTMTVLGTLSVEAKTPPSQESWINPRAAYFLVCQMMGLTEEQSHEPAKADEVFGRFRQLAHDGELAVRGQFVRSTKIESSGPITDVPQAHWLTHEFQGLAYVTCDDEQAVRLLGTERPESNWLTVDRYQNLAMKQSDVEHHFKAGLLARPCPTCEPR